MRIFIVSPTLTNGGAERVASMLAKGFSQRGHDVTIVTHTNQKISYDPGPDVRLLPIAPEKKNKVLKWMGAVRLLHEYMVNYKPEIAIGIMEYCSYLTRISAIGTPTKVVLTEHSAFKRIEGYPLKKKVKFLRKWIDHHFRYVTVLTEQDKKVGGKKYEHAFVMPNPISFQPYTGDVRDLNKEKYVLAVGRIFDWYVKGFDVLIKAWGVVSHHKDYDAQWKLKIAGTGKPEDIKSLMSICKQNDVEDSVEFLGFREDMLNLYRKASIFCLSSRSEGLPMSLLEAMSQGCAPIATSNLGRTAEIITSEEEGFICEPENAEEMAAKLLNMMNSVGKRHDIQMNAIKRSRHYSLENTINRWETFLLSIIK